MYGGKRVAVVMPAYNAEKTLCKAYEDVVAQDVADTIIIVDDCSKDGTEAVARNLCSGGEGTRRPTVLYRRHEKNRGYGGNQKSCYDLALKAGADIGEVSCPTVYMDEALSISFRRSVKYGFGCVFAAFRFRMRRLLGCKGYL